MRKKQMDWIILAISVCGFVIMSCSFIIMPFENVGILPGLLFWAGLLVGCILQVVLEIHRRAFFKKLNVKREKAQKPRNGLLSFGSNKWASIADGAMIIGLVATVLAFIFTKGLGYICYVLIAITVLSFCLHCILNGRNYFHLNNQAKIRQALEQKSQIHKVKERKKK